MSPRSGDSLSYSVSMHLEVEEDTWVTLTAQDTFDDLEEAKALLEKLNDVDIDVPRQVEVH